MRTLEDIEKALTELPADRLAEFRAWFETSTLLASTNGSSATLERADLTDSLNRPSPISAPAAPEL